MDKEVKVVQAVLLVEVEVEVPPVLLVEMEVLPVLVEVEVLPVLPVLLVVAVELKVETEYLDFKKTCR